VLGIIIVKYTRRLIILFLLALTVAFWAGAKEKRVEVDSGKLFHSQLYLDLFYTYKLYTTKIAAINSGKIIRGPVLSWQLLAEFTSLSSQLGSEVLCLFYKIPIIERQKGGVLRLVNADKKGRCQGRFLEAPRAELTEIKSVKMDLPLPSRRRANGKGDAYNFTLHVKMLYEIAGRKQGKSYLFPLMNLDLNNIQHQEGTKRVRKMPAVLGLRRYHSLEISRVVPGVMILPDQADRLLARAKINMIPSGEICQQVNDQCEVVGDVTCDRCKTPSFPVISSKCQKIFSRVCGPIRCGSRGAPACIRGFNYLHQPIDSGCFKGSPAGLCEDGLHTFCDESRVLVCL
jgi:hypothetical protein